jgi:HAD superfamily hydrolase (TIGR01509 family)
MNVKGYIFDYGGTLDSGGHHWGKVLWHAYERAGVPVSEQQFRDVYVSVERYLGTHAVIRPDFTFYRTLGTKIAMQLELLGKEQYAAGLVGTLYQQTRSHLSHSREVLCRLPGKKVLVSNFYGNIHTVLKEFGLETMFVHVIESAVVGVRKPDPRIFELGVQALGLPPAEVLVIGDSVEKDIRPACMIGCTTAWLRGEQWDDAPVDAVADYVIDDLSELVEITNLNKKQLKR